MAGPFYGSADVQTDDVGAIWCRAVTGRCGGGHVSEGGQPGPLSPCCPLFPPPRPPPPPWLGLTPSLGVRNIFLRCVCTPAPCTVSRLSCRPVQRGGGAFTSRAGDVHVSSAPCPRARRCVPAARLVLGEGRAASAARPRGRAGEARGGEAGRPAGPREGWGRWRTEEEPACSPRLRPSLFHLLRDRRGGGTVFRRMQLRLHRS